MNGGSSRRRKAEKLGAPAAEDLIATVPDLQQLLSQQNIAVLQKVIDASYLNPVFEKKYREALKGAVTAQSGQLVLMDEAEVRRAHRILDRRVVVSKGDGHIRLDHNKMLTADALVPRTNNPDEAEYLMNVRSMLNSVGVWLRIEQPWHLVGSDPSVWKFWFSLGRNGETIKTKDAIIDREELLETPTLYDGYYNKVLTGQILSKLDRAFDKFDTAFQNGFSLHLDLWANRIESPFVANVSDFFGGADFPPRTIWDGVRNFRNAAWKAKRSGDIETARVYLMTAAHLAEYNTGILNIYLSNTIKGGLRVQIALEITHVACGAFISVVETVLLLTGTGFVSKAVRAAGKAALNRKTRHSLADQFLKKWSKRNNIAEAELKTMRYIQQKPATILGGRKGGHSAGGGKGFHKYP